MSDYLRFVVPLVPPSVNHYKVKTKRGITYVTKEAKAFKAAVAIFAMGQSIADPKRKYGLNVTVYLGKGKRGDGDNFFKCIGDGLKEAGVVHSDAAIKVWTINVERDWANPRTEITVAVLACKRESESQ